ITASTGGGDMERSPIFLKTVQKLGNRDPGWIDGPTALQFHDQASTLDLRLFLGALERVPAAFAPAGGVQRINDDGPVTGRPFAKMSFHSSLSGSKDLINASILARISLRYSWSR